MSAEENSFPAYDASIILKTWPNVRRLVHRRLLYGVVALDELHEVHDLEDLLPRYASLYGQAVLGPRPVLELDLHPFPQGSAAPAGPDKWPDGVNL